MDQRAKLQPGWVQHIEPFEFGHVRSSDRFEPIGKQMRSVLLEAGFRLDGEGRMVGVHTIQDEGTTARVYRQHVGL
jgi:hypothetical protein